MKKLMLIGSGYYHTYNFARLVSPYFQEIRLIADRRDPDQPIHTTVLNFSLRNPFNLFKTRQRIMQEIREYQPSLIHIHQANSFATLGLWASRRIRIPTVLTAWGSDVLILPKRNFLMKKMVSWNLRHANALTADAHFMAKAMHQVSGIPESKIHIINFGIQPPVETLPVKEKIIYSNRLHKPLYRIGLILSAFRRFRETDTGKSWRLVVAGEGPETERLKQQAEQEGISGAVQFTGWQNAAQNQEWYSRSSLFVSIPESDGTSVSLLEAMAFGCMPVVSDLPANREWIVHGRNGFVVGNLKHDFLSEALMINPEEAAELNRDIIRQRATVDVSRAAFFHVYDQVLRHA